MFLSDRGFDKFTFHSTNEPSTEDPMKEEKKKRRRFYFANGLFFRKIIYSVYNKIKLIIKFVRITFENIYERTRAGIKRA